MNYNLISDQWITVKDFNSNIQKIKPEQVVDPQWDTLDTPRADLKGALFQFMIGLLQTAFAPGDQEQWEKYWETPPSEEVLGKSFARFQHAFYLNNDESKPAFMQDFDLSDGEQKPVVSLLLEAPGEKTLKDNQDHFIKRGMIQKMSAYWAALSLFTLQINAPAGGAGHRVGIRGGGPMTTLLIPPENLNADSLWHRLWLNVLTLEEMEHTSGNLKLSEDKNIFPWLTETRTSESKGMEVLPEHAHPLQMYWAMPRRIRLQWDMNQKEQCDISGEPVETMVTHYNTKNYGANYEGYWRHPLSAYDVPPDKVPNSVKAQTGGLSYRHWMGLVIEDPKKHRQPALIVRSYKEWRCNSIGGLDEAQLWSFGYDMDNMKARCWYEASMPVFSLSEQLQLELDYQVPKIIEAANDSLKTLKKALKMAWFKRPKDAKGDISFIDHSFWEQTESAFYNYLRLLINQLDNEQAIKKVLNKWRQSLQSEAIKIFDNYVLSSLNEDGDMKRIIKARKYLEKWLNVSKPMKVLKVA